MSPIRVDFYLLAEDGQEPIGTLACRLLEKAYQQGQQIFVYCDNQREAEWLDELLWSFKEVSFIPHHLQGEGPEPPPPIQIGTEAPQGFNQILMNLSHNLPPFYRQFRRVLELIAPKDKELARARYRHYRLDGCILHSHEMKCQAMPT